MKSSAFSEMVCYPVRGLYYLILRRCWLCLLPPVTRTRFASELVGTGILTYASSRHLPGRYVLGVRPVFSALAQGVFLVWAAIARHCF